MKDDILSLLKKEYSFENKQGARIVSLNSADTCRFFILDFPIYKEQNFSKTKYKTGKVKPVDLDAYYFLETPEGYEYSINTSADTMGFERILIEKGRVKSIEEHEEYLLMALNFSKLSLIGENTESNLLIESPSQSIECNIFMGEIDNKLVFCLFVNQRRRSLSLSIFRDFLKI